MIKKIFALFMAFVLCVAATYMDSEQKYFFASDALIEALQNNVEDEQKRTDAATKYSELMNQETGMVSIDNLFAVCRTAGFNTYRKEGFDSCKQFINALIELDENALSGFCPGLDEKGNNPNSLKSITNETRVGDFCSSMNIYAGEVVFKKGYNCTCMAYACNDGFEFKGGACVTMVADGQGFCLRSDNKIQKDMKLEEAKAFCEDLANKNKCKYKSAVIKHKDLRILCNATTDEVDHAKQLMFESKEKQKANMKYYEVCDDDKGKIGTGKEFCIKGVFNWVNVGQKEAVGLAQEYAKVKNGHNIICATKYRTSGNDDYIKCATTDKKYYYEFQFDDVVESVDSDIAVGIVKGLEAIYGDMDYKNCGASKNRQLVSAASKYGLQLIKRGDLCYFDFQSVKEDELATIEGLDNRVFYDDIQIKGSQQIEEYLKKYIKSKNIVITSFQCANGYKKMDKALMMGLKEKDDVLRCVLNNKPIDFVFDDTSELSKERDEAGHAGINCKISGGKYAGKRCHGLSQQQCTDVDVKLKQINPGSAGAVWQDNQCVLVDVQQQSYIETGVQIGLSVIALADCATTVVGNAQGVMGCTLAVVEIAGLATELTTGEAMQNRAQEFIAQSIKCQEHACALTTIRDLAPKVVSIQDALKSASTAKAVDEELARLIDLLEPEDLQSECKGDCNYQDLISALGGDPSDASGTALKVANKVGFVAQFASLGASVFRLSGRAIAKLGSRATKTAGNVTKTATKVADKADDVTGAVWDATAKRFRDPKTGRFVSGYTSWNKELAEIGVKESVVNGKTVYTDIKTGKALSETQVLNKIPTSMNDDFAKIGVRQIEQSDGSVRYMDIRPGGGNKFISEAEVLKRIDDMPVSATKAVDDVADKTSSVTRTVSKTENVSALRNKVSDVFDAHLADVKRGKKVALFDKSKLTDEEWQMLNKSLEKEGVKLEKDAFGNMELKRIESTSGIRMSTAETARGAKAADATKDAGKAADKAVEEAEKLFDLKFPGFKKAGNGEFKVSDKTFSWALGQEKAEALMREGYYAKIVPTKGVSKGEEYVVVAIKKSDVSGQLMWDGENLVKQVDNSAFLRNLDVYRSEEITKIGNTPVFIEDVGSISGRGIVTVRVGEKKIPFYVSTGTAGKTAVPTGKWEVFWGIGEDGWFNKAGIKEINNHYDSEELRQIAYALDSKLGDPRSTELVLETIGRNSQGGTGIVGLADIGPISENAINSGFKSTPGTYSNSWHMHENIHDVTEYLKNLH